MTDIGSVSYDNLISAAECAIIVKNSLSLNESAIVNYNVQKIPGHLGFLGEYFRLDVTVKINGIRSCERYFLKSLPITDRNQREMMEQIGFFWKEVQVYAKILAAFGNNEGRFKWRPECYHVRSDLIVMEDLTWRSGFRMMQFETTLDQNHLLAVLEAVSQMHAVSLHYELNVIDGKRLDEIYNDVLFETTVTRNNSWFMAGLCGIKVIALNATKYCYDSEKKKLMEQELDNKLIQIFEVIKPTTRFQSVLVHRDIWMNNLMFRYEKGNPNGPNSCVLLDFQICRYLPPVIDVLLAIYQTTRRSHREEFMQYYLKFYYDSVTAKLKQFSLDAKQVLSWEQFQESLKHYKIIPHVFTGVYMALTNLPTNVLDELQRNDPKLYNQYCNVNRDELILKYLREDECYRETMVECVEELLEYFFGFHGSSTNDQLAAT